jgi:hypothetical protein
MRFITLPALDYRRVSLRSYVRAIRLAKANPETEFKHGLTTWWPTTGAEIMRQFWKGVEDRINEAIPYQRRGL